jgi:hypothetical protein
MIIARLCISDEIDKTDCPDLDLRTRSGNEDMVRRQIEKYGKISVFWATENQKRAWAIDRLEDKGEIVRINPNPYHFPWCGYKTQKNEVE